MKAKDGIYTMKIRTDKKQLLLAIPQELRKELNLSVGMLARIRKSQFEKNRIIIDFEDKNENLPQEQ